MRRRIWIVPLAAALVAVLGMGQGAGSDRHSPFDPATVATFDAELLRVEQIDRDDHVGLHLWVRADGEERLVLVGPRWVTERAGFLPRPGDGLIVTASRVDKAGSDAWVATELSRGELVVELRTPEGRPLWAGTGPDGVGRSRHEGERGRHAAECPGACKRRGGSQ